MENVYLMYGYVMVMKNVQMALMKEIVNLVLVPLISCGVALGGAFLRLGDVTEIATAAMEKMNPPIAQIPNIILVTQHTSNAKTISV